MDVNRTTLKLWYSKQKYYEFEGKGEKILAGRIKNYQMRKNIKVIRNGKGVLKTEPKKILESFLAFYNKLYANKGIKNREIDRYCEELQFPELSEEGRRELEKNVTEEVKKAIDSMNVQSAPGLDGFNAVF